MSDFIFRNAEFAESHGEKPTRELTHNERLEIISHSFECPFGEAVPDCIFRGLRKYPLKKRMQMMSELSDERLLAIYRKASLCYEHRRQLLREPALHKQIIATREAQSTRKVS